MRFGLVIDTLDVDRPLDDLVARATAAERVGFDLVWLTESPTLPAPAVAAAALAPQLSTVRVGIDVVAGVNPVYLAEEAAVADQCLGGRLVLAARSTDPDLLAETIDVLVAATAARPFRHEGPRWQIPANRPENVVNRQQRVRITPATAQLELPIWVTGPNAAAVAVDRCLPFVGELPAPSLATEWQRAENALGPAVHRMRRVAVRDVPVAADGAVDDDALVHALRTDYRAWGLEIALLRLPDQAAPTRNRNLERLASRALPRLQLDQLPPGLEDYWKHRKELDG
jgi:alkanesulfonate monooxygenase SsuD/methylene tetrahydromethanopterin reductase-like flavin-dependent oxidoreductase (luciferase family)